MTTKQTNIRLSENTLDRLDAHRANHPDATRTSIIERALGEYLDAMFLPDDGPAGDAFGFGLDDRDAARDLMAREAATLQAMTKQIHDYTTDQETHEIISALNVVSATVARVRRRLNDLEYNHEMEVHRASRTTD